MESEVSEMPNKILVTGAGGNVGREVIKELSDRGRPFVAAVRNETDGRREWGRPTATVRFDFADPATYAAAFDGIGQLFLVRPPAISVIERYLFPVIDFARSAGVEQIVFLSLLGVNRRVPHYQVEKKIEASGIPYTFLRPSYSMQILSTVTGMASAIRTRFSCRPAAARRASLMCATLGPWQPRS